MGKISTAGGSGFGGGRFFAGLPRFPGRLLAGLCLLLVSCGALFAADAGMAPLDAILERLSAIDGEVRQQAQEYQLLRRDIEYAIDNCDPRFDGYMLALGDLIRHVNERAHSVKDTVIGQAKEYDRLIKQLGGMMPGVTPLDAASEFAQVIAGAVPIAGTFIDGLGALQDLQNKHVEGQESARLIMEAYNLGLALKDMLDFAKELKNIYDEMENERRRLIQEWNDRQPCEAPSDAPPAADSFFDVWLEASKEEVTDSDTGEPLEEATITVQPREGTVEKDPDSFVPKTGDRIVVSAPCHVKETYVVGEDAPPRVLALTPKPIRFTIECDSVADAEERIREYLFKQGITYDRKDTAFMATKMENADGEELCVYSVIKYAKRIKDRCPCEDGAVDEPGIPGELDKSPKPPAAGTPRTPFEPDEGRQGEEIAALPNDPFYMTAGSWGQRYSDQWGLRRIGLDFSEKQPMSEAWPDEAEPVIVAVIDTGVDRNHPELFGAIWMNSDEIPDNGEDDDKNGYVDDYYGWNFVDNDNNTLDNNGHGTLVAGIIAAWPGNGVGIAGVNPWARIMPVKATDFNNRGWSIDLSKAVKYAVDNGARVINVSIGGKNLTMLEQAALDYANDKGAVVIVAAGNKGVNTGNYSPAGLNGAITVAATDTKDQRVGFSNWGQEVDLSAPGVDILSLRAAGSDLLVFEKDDYVTEKAVVGPDKRYYRASGTSFSAPFVTGAASLILSRNPGLDNEEVKRMILQSTRDISMPGFDQYTGYGLLDTRAALHASPDFFIDSRILKIEGVKSKGATYIGVNGVCMADRFDKAWIEAGMGPNPDKWVKVSKDIKKEVNRGELALISPKALMEANQWTLRLIVKHKNGETRESRFALKLR